MKFKIQYTAKFEIEIECEQDELDDAISNIEIPENEQSSYIQNSFEVIVP